MRAVPRHGELAPGLPYLVLGQGSPLVVLVGFGPARTRPLRLADRRELPFIRPYAGHFATYAVFWRPDRPAAGTTMADIAGEYASAIRSAFGQPVPVIGMSTGGSIAQQLAVDHPDVVQRLVLAITAHRLGERGLAAQLAAAALARQGRDRQAWRSYTNGLVDSRSAQWALATVSWLTSAGFTPSMLALLDAENAFDIGDRLAEITAPTLVVAGGRDLCYGRQLITETAARIPGARLLLYPGRGHIGAGLDRRLPRDILAFLTESQSGTSGLMLAVEWLKYR